MPIFEGKSGSSIIRESEPQKQISDQTTPVAYLHYDVTTTYREVPGNVMMPSQHEEVDNLPVKTHNPFFYRIVEFTIVSMGREPETIPSPTRVSVDEILLGRSIVTPSPNFGSDGVPIFTVAGVYVFENAKPPESGTPLPYRFNPTGTSNQNYSLRPEHFN